jgi:hypothetical protein
LKTVRELADAIKVSRVSVYKALKRDDMQGHVIKRDNMTHIDEIGEQILVNLFSKVNSKVNSEVKSDGEILFLREQNKMLTEKLAALADELVRLNENNQILLREHNLAKLSPPKASWWKRLFGKRHN